MTWPQRLVATFSQKGQFSDWFASRAGPLGTYVATTALVGVALGLRLFLTPWLIGAQFITFFPAVIVATLACGTAPGVVSVVLSALAARYFLEPGGFSIQEGYSLAFFIAVALMDVAVISLLLAANAALKASLVRIEDLNVGLAVSEARFRNLLENAPDAMVIVDGRERIVLVNAEAERMFGYKRSEMLGQGMDLLMPQRFQGEHCGRIGSFIADPRIRRMGYGRDLYGRRRDGSEFPIETNLSLLSLESGGLVASAIRDITARREAEERQGLLIRELNHRVKNALASVQAIVSHTLTNSRSPEAFSAALTTRLGALSQSHDVLTRSDWVGAELRDLVQEQLGPYGEGDDRRFRIGGPAVKLTPSRAITLGMVLGELATNAAKYGALSVEEGTVAVEWEVHDRAGHAQLGLAWTERGGPKVGPVGPKGFGTRLIERSAAGGLAGSARLAFEPEGLVCRIEFELQAGET
jgi:PAS domain S-box-containing protein